MRIEEARFLKEKHLPASLYKYAAFTNTVSKEGAEKLKQNVEGSGVTKTAFDFQRPL